MEFNVNVMPCSKNDLSSFFLFINMSSSLHLLIIHKSVYIQSLFYCHSQTFRHEILHL